MHMAPLIFLLLLCMNSASIYHNLPNACDSPTRTAVQQGFERSSIAGRERAKHWPKETVLISAISRVCVNHQETLMNIHPLKCVPMLGCQLTWRPEEESAFREMGRMSGGSLSSGAVSVRYWLTWLANRECWKMHRFGTCLTGVFSCALAGTTKRGPLCHLKNIWLVIYLFI